MAPPVTKQSLSMGPCYHQGVQARQQRLPQDCPLTFYLASQGLADHSRVLLLVCWPLVHKQGCVGRAGVKHDPKLGTTWDQKGVDANILVTQLNIFVRSPSQTLVSAGRRTLVAFTRMRMSMVRPEAAATPNKAMKTRSFQESPMVVGAGLQGSGRQQWTLRLLAQILS